MPTSPLHDPAMQAFADDLAQVFAKHRLELHSDDYIQVVPIDHSYVVIGGGEDLQFTLHDPRKQPKSRVVRTPPAAVASIHDAFIKQQETTDV